MRIGFCFEESQSWARRADGSNLAAFARYPSFHRMRTAIVAAVNQIKKAVAYSTALCFRTNITCSEMCYLGMR